MHRPERWGYVQFTAEKGQVDFRPDPALPARDVLMGIYHAERDFRRRQGRWAELNELGLSRLAHPSFVEGPSLSLVEAGYGASVRIRGSGGAVERWNTRQDSRLWRD